MKIFICTDYIADSFYDNSKHGFLFS